MKHYNVTSFPFITKISHNSDRVLCEQHNNRKGRQKEIFNQILGEN